MPIPFIVAGAIAASTAVGAKKTYDATKDIKKAKKVNNKAQRISKRAEKKLNTRRKQTKSSLDELGKTKLEVLSNNMKKFVEEYSKIKNIDFHDSVGLEELKNLNFSDNSLKELRQASFEAFDILKGGLSSLGSGALAAYGTYGAVGALATASTGTGIAGLSGAAATNATLAWLGGGALSAGGYGIAGGMAVLGGLVAGPALAVGGVVMASTAKKKLNSAHNNLDKARIFENQAENAVVALNGVMSRADKIRNVLNELNDYFKTGVTKMSFIIDDYGVDWNDYSKNAKDVIYVTTQLAQTLKIILDSPLLDEKGKVTQQSKKALLTGQKYLSNVTVLQKS